MNKISSYTYSNFVKKIVEEYPGSVQELADSIGTTRNNIYLWTRGTTKPREVNYKRIIKALALISKIEVKVNNNDSISILEGESGMASVNTNKLIDSYQTTISLLKEKVDKLELEVQSPNLYIEHPEAFDEMAKLLENITKQWDWTFYHSPNPMSCSRNNKVKAINPELEKALGWTEEEMVGIDILDFIHKDDLEKTKKALTQKDRNLTVRIKKKNGNHCSMRVKAKEFGINGKKYSIGLMTCVARGCTDCGGLK